MTDQTTPKSAGRKPAVSRDWGGARSVAAVLALLLSAGLIAKLMWTHEPVPKRIVRFEITKFVGNHSRSVVTARTRTIYLDSNSNMQAGISTTAKQIQLPSGLWIDCRGNCADAYRASQFR